ncbi:MAG: 4'-phosphopantetheinyl transferase superfamily protein [Pseudomonadota bacterium]
MSAPRQTVEVFVWPLAVVEPRFVALLELLSHEERARFESAALPDRAREFVIGRGIARQLLGRRLGVAPPDVALTTSPHGRPGLADHPRATLDFNLSHSGGIAAMAISTVGPCGIDIEAPRPLTSTLWGAALSEAEREALEDLPEDDRTAGLFRRWVAKEAILKGIGTGLSGHWRDMAVTVTPDAAATPPAQCVITLEGGRWPPDDGHEWRVRGFEPAAGFAGAVAVQSAETEIALNVQSLDPNMDS